MEVSYLLTYSCASLKRQVNSDRELHFLQYSERKLLGCSAIAFVLADEGCQKKP